MKGGDSMIKKIIKKLGIGGSIGIGSLLVAGVAFATFLVTQNVSTGNTVTSASAGLTITNTPINTAGLQPGGSTPNNTLVIKNTGNIAGDVKLNIVNATGTICSQMSLAVTGDTTGSFNPIANGSIDLGNLNPGSSLNLIQVVSLSSSSTSQGFSCTWNETATISG